MLPKNMVMRPILTADAQALYDLIRMPIIAVNGDGSIAYVNEALVSMTQRSREEWEGKFLWHIAVQQTDAQFFLRFIETAAEQEYPFELSFYLDVADKRMIVLWSAVYVRDSSSQEPCFLLTAIQMEPSSHDLQKKIERYYRDLFEDAPMMYVVLRFFEGRQRLRIESCNSLFLEKTGYALEEVYGRRLSSFYTSSSSIFEPTPQLHKSDSAIEFHTSVERRLVTKEGDVLDLLVKASPLFDHKGHLVEVRVMLVDITEQKFIEQELDAYKHKLEDLVEERTNELMLTNAALVQEIQDRLKVEQSLRRSEHLHQQLIHNLPKAAVFLFDMNLRYLIANGQALGMQGYNDLKNKTVYEVLSPERAAIMVQFYKSVLNGQQLSFERTFGDRSFYVHGTPLRDEKDEIYAGMIVAQDVTEIREAEKRHWDLAMQRERVAILHEFIDNTSHDLRTPLTVIKANLYVLQKSLQDDDRFTRKFQIMGKQIDRLEMILRTMLDMSELDRYNRDTFLEVIELGEFLQMLVLRFKIPSAQKKQVLVYDKPSTALYILADRTSLMQALSNLLDNAVQYSDSEGQIVMEAGAADENQVLVTIQDEGDGISDNDIPLIFERFYRVNKARTTGQGGVGLGLTIAKTIVEAHQGQIWVTSELGERSTFYIRFPMHKAGV
ncbi:MAG: PAS domain S-box protein [Anaerolineales bacterium]|nr:PAS domain S-box protein [Anaerolineales bacterium]